MRRIESWDDEKNMLVTYEIAGGQRIKLDLMQARKYGAERLIRDLGFDPGDVGIMLPVFQSGRQVGQLPANFDPHTAGSKSFFYDPRPGDFRRDGERWIANGMLGDGDLEAVPGFKWDRR